MSQHTVYISSSWYCTFIMNNEYIWTAVEQIQTSYSVSLVELLDKWDCLNQVVFSNRNFFFIFVSLLVGLFFFIFKQTIKLKIRRKQTKAFSLILIYKFVCCLLFKFGFKTKANWMVRLSWNILCILYVYGSHVLTVF